VDLAARLTSEDMLQYMANRLLHSPLSSLNGRCCSHLLRRGSVKLPHRNTRPGPGRRGVLVYRDKNGEGLRCFRWGTTERSRSPPCGASKGFMKITPGPAVWPAALLGLAGLTYAIVREQRVSKAVRELRGKVVLLTGGARGLGYAIARELALSGARLALTSRDADQLERARARLLASGSSAPADVWVHACDVSVEPQVRGLVAAATTHFGRIDVVVNDAGIIMVGPLESQSLAGFHEAMNVNFFGALHTTLAVLPQMLERREGAIVNISSIGGKIAFPHLLPYVASKFAVTGWSQGLRAELAGKGIRVTTVSPGIMRTGSHIQARFTGDKEREYRWFAAAASLPGTATDATSAARKIVRALAAGSAEISVGLAAIVAARVANCAPELTATLLSLANASLPSPPSEGAADFWRADQSTAGSAFQGSLPSSVERLGARLIQRYNQEPTASTL
jgi:short-subunit dehydrogenase